MGSLTRNENGEGEGEDEDDGGALGKLENSWLGLGSLHNGGEVMEEEERMEREMGE